MSCYQALNLPQERADYSFSAIHFHRYIHILHEGIDTITATTRGYPKIYAFTSI
jgi:hypothetical protein